MYRHSVLDLLNQRQIFVRQGTGQLQSEGDTGDAYEHYVLPLNSESLADSRSEVLGRIIRFRVQRRLNGVFTERSHAGALGYRFVEVAVSSDQPPARSP